MTNRCRYIEQFTNFHFDSILAYWKRRCHTYIEVIVWNRWNMWMRILSEHVHIRGFVVELIYVSSSIALCWESRWIIDEKEFINVSKVWQLLCSILPVLEWRKQITKRITNIVIVVWNIIARDGTIFLGKNYFQHHIKCCRFTKKREVRTMHIGSLALYQKL